MRDYTSYWHDLRSSHSNHPGNRFRYDLIVREIRRLNRRPVRLIDCGCGDGALLEAVTRELSVEEAYGMDVAPNAPASRSVERFHFRQHDLANPVSESLHARFDLVLCSEVIEHVTDDDSVLRNLARLVSPRGNLIITTQSGRIYKTEAFLGHLRHYTLEDLTARLEHLGLRIRSAYHCGWPWLNLQKIAAHVFQETVQKQIVQPEKLSRKIALLFLALHRIYWFSSNKRGPQLVIVAEKT